ncbi:aldehyde dehydrogenase domain-containing protein [Sphaerosporella brunnea]|uniref:Aldehyde dehydrogenase domain-containing protein n=1 Tax=Sphaerosporella brunnea TaxID=1250544 RepID=A0A5J5EVZ1_9PEZI|nr:aldehyde dehydrogenase domain-containing protein [Sphaerosporella brunnea]
MASDKNLVIPLVINGKEIVSAKTFPVTSPATGEVLWHSSSASLEDVDKAIAAATAALPEWKATRLSKRRDMILKVAEELEKNQAAINETMKVEVAADQGWCDFNISNTLEMLRGVASRVCSLEGRIPESNASDLTAMVVREPYGVVLAIAPWNAPVILAARSIIFPLAAGNTVIFKSSELSPHTQYLLTQCFLNAGFPPGAINILGHCREDAPKITEALIKAPSVRKVNFTGSTAVGRRVAAMCGENLKPVTLELGGKAPMIVCSDADIEKAAGAGAFGAFYYAGQTCMATEKILVHNSIASEFTTALKATVERMFGPSQVLIQSAGPRRVAGLLSHAAEKGAQLHPATPTELVNPNEHHNVIVTGVNTDMDLWHAESFGPVVMIAEFETEEEAILKANDTEYGLSAAVWTNDLAKGIRIARQIESGAVHINGATVYDEIALPHGGLKNSGYGRFNGTWGLEEFTTTKTITFRV